MGLWWQSVRQVLGEALLDAEVRIGELLKANPPKSLQDDFGIMRGKTPLPDGISRNLSSQCQQLSEYPDLVAEAKACQGAFQSF